MAPKQKLKKVVRKRKERKRKPKPDEIPEKLIVDHADRKK